MALSPMGPMGREADRLAWETAALAGETRTDAIRIALAERLEHKRPNRRQPGDRADRIRATGERCASLPDHDGRSQDEILGYDETGLWC